MESWRDQAVGDWDRYVIAAWYTRMYARRHSIPYRLLSVPGERSFRAAFLKFRLLRDVLKDYDVVITMDHDLFVSNFEQNVLCLLERWGFNCDADTPVMLESQDPPGDDFNWRKWPNGSTVLNTNTGFTIWRNTPRMFEILDDYLEAAMKRFDEWEDLVPLLDQLIFNTDQRPYMTESLFPYPLDPNADLRLVPCDEANGHQWLTMKGDWYGDLCQGQYVTHAWSNKEGTREEMLRRLMTLAVQEVMHWGGHTYLHQWELWHALSEEEEEEKKKAEEEQKEQEEGQHERRLAAEEDRLQQQEQEGHTGQGTQRFARKGSRRQLWQRGDARWDSW